MGSTDASVGGAALADKSGDANIGEGRHHGSILDFTQKRGAMTPTQTTIAAGAGSTLTSLIVTPFDVVKTRMQAHSGASLTMPSPSSQGASGISAAARMQNQGIWGTFKNIAKVESPQVLWRGLGASLVLAVPSSALYMTVYERLRDELDAVGVHQPGIQSLVGGAAARVLSATLFSPVDLFRTIVQSRVPGDLAKGTSEWGLLQNQIKARGVTTLWRGLGPTLVRDVPFSAVYWGLYEQIKHSTAIGVDLALETCGKGCFSEVEAGSSHSLYNGLGWGISFVSGAAAGMAAAWFTTPFDVIKTHIQTETVQFRMALKEGAPGATSVSQISLLKYVYKTEGIRGVFTGAWPRCVKVAPACAIMISTYSACQRAFDTVDPVALE